MKLKKSLLLYSLLVGIIVIAGAIYYTFRSSPDSVEKIKADFELSAAQLVAAFEEDEEDANELYVDKVVKITGEVAEVSKETDDKTLIYLNGESMSNISCLFVNEALKGTDPKAGDTITIKGKCNGYILDVVLTKCVVVK